MLTTTKDTNEYWRIKGQLTRMGVKGDLTKVRIFGTQDKIDLLKPIKIPKPTPTTIPKPRPPAIPKPKTNPQEDWVKSVSKKEKESVMAWTDTMEGVVPIRDYQMGFTEHLTSKELSTAKTFTKLIDRAPSYKGKIYRGTSIDPDFRANEIKQIVPGKTFSFGGSSSASKDFKVAKDFASLGDELGDLGTKTYVFEIKAVNGVSLEELNIGTVKAQKEVLLRSNARLKIESVTWKKDSLFNEGGYYKVIANEIL